MLQPHKAVAAADQTTNPGKLSRGIWITLWAVTLVGMVATLCAIAFWAPVELQMGIVQKIFYVHVPSAYAMYLGFFVSAVASAIYLKTHHPRADAWGQAGAEVGVLFCAIVLLTGPLWARKAWGLWWTWDPRLTTTMLAGMVFAAYLALRSLGTTGEVERRFSAGIAIVGILDIPLIHYSVQRWQGQHPQVISKGGGGLDPTMGATLGISMATFTALVALLLWTRARSLAENQSITELTWAVEDLEHEAAHPVQETQ